MDNFSGFDFGTSRQIEEVHRSVITYPRRLFEHGEKQGRIKCSETV